MTRYLIAGAGGMLGTALRAAIEAREGTCAAPAESGFDITDERVVADVVRRFADGLEPGERGVVVNAAAYTNVERAEEEPDVAYRVNEDGARILAQAASANGLTFVHVSTDFVFDGTKRGPYVETDQPNPLSVYGASKLAGECAVLSAAPGALIVRTAWTFGPGGQNFPMKILDLALGHDVLSVVNDEIGSPTYTRDLAAGIVGLLEARATGVYHLVNAGMCSRFELAEQLLGLVGLERTLVPVTSAEFPTKAARPANSVLDCSKAAALGVVMPDWLDALARFVDDDVQGR